MAEVDPGSWIREIGLHVPWEYELLEAFVGAYLGSESRRREQLQRALPGLECEARLWRALRSGRRGN